MNFTKDQLFCLLGPNGAGKTTAINCLTGITPVTGGDGDSLSLSLSQFILLKCIEGENYIWICLINSIDLWRFNPKLCWHVKHSKNYRSLSPGDLCLFLCLYISSFLHVFSNV